MVFAISRISSIGFALSIMLLILFSIGSRLDQKAQAIESNYRIEDLMDAIDISLALDREDSQCPPSSWNKSLSSLVSSHLLSYEWSTNKEFTPSVVFRTITSTTGRTYEAPAFVQVTYKPLDSSMLTSLWNHQLLVRIDDAEAVFVRPVNTSYSSTNSYFDSTDGCSVNSTR